MAIARYRIVERAGTWAVEHAGEAAGDYATKEAAFESVIGPASNAIKEGLGVSIEVPPRSDSGEPALGAR